MDNKRVFRLSVEQRKERPEGGYIHNYNEYFVLAANVIDAIRKFTEKYPDKHLTHITVERGELI